MNNLNIYYYKWVYKLGITHQQSSIRNLNCLKVSSFIYLGQILILDHTIGGILHIS